MESAYDQAYIDARESLLDAIEALGPHGNAAILVGAQAVYVHTESNDDGIAVSAFTYDADIALDPQLLPDSPKIIEAMNRAGFHLPGQPGLYKSSKGAQVDLLVPAAVGGPGRRGARLGPHSNRAAMKVPGLEGALVSHIPRRIASLDPAANRSHILKVAGPAALLVSKVHKIEERLDDGNIRRQTNLSKDALDVYRLLLAIETNEIAQEFQLLHSSEISRAVTSNALSKFRTLFGARDGEGTTLLVKATQALEDPEFIAASSIALSEDLLAATGQ